MRLAVPADPADTGKWLTDQPRRGVVLLGIALMPFAGTAFLWFVGVIRDRIGDAEDRFFATLFLGSGLLFVAMLLVAAATAAGLVASVESESDLATSDAWTIGRNVTLALLQGGLQIVSVFTIAASTILLRTSTGRDWLALTGYVISAMLLTLVPFFPWIALLFPAWVLAISLDILVADFRRDARVI